MGTTMGKYKWYSRCTGEIVGTFADVLRMVKQEWECYGFLNWNWKYSRQGW